MSVNEYTYLLTGASAQNNFYRVLQHQDPSDLELSIIEFGNEGFLTRDRAQDVFNAVAPLDPARTSEAPSQQTIATAATAPVVITVSPLCMGASRSGEAVPVIEVISAAQKPRAETAITFGSVNFDRSARQLEFGAARAKEIEAKIQDFAGLNIDDDL